MVQHPEEKIGYIAYGTAINNNLAFKDLQKNKQFGQFLHNSKVVDKIQGSIYVGKPSQLVDNNILYVGDAANLMDPLFSYGITPSVKSAIFAAKSRYVRLPEIIHDPFFQGPSNVIVALNKLNRVTP